MYNNMLKYEEQEEHYTKHTQTKILSYTKRNKNNIYN